MLYKFNICVSEKDYFDLNVFWLTKSHYGKKQLLSLRILFAAILLFFSLVSLFGGGFTHSAFLNIIPLIVLLAVSEILLIPFLKLILKLQLRHMKKKGKMPFSASSVMEFYDNSFTESTDENKTEVKYSAIERISVVNDKFIYIHINNLMAYIIPIFAFESKEQYNSFMSFIKTKNSNISFY